MSVPHKCPVCDGSGKLWQMGDEGDCHVCKGTGVVWEPMQSEVAEPGATKSYVYRAHEALVSGREIEPGPVMEIRGSRDG